jgi:hypothetical protein
MSMYGWLFVMSCYLKDLYIQWASFGLSGRWTLMHARRVILASIYFHEDSMYCDCNVSIPFLKWHVQKQCSDDQNSRLRVVVIEAPKPMVLAGNT